MSFGPPSVSAGCERLPGSKGKGESSRAGPPRPLAAQTPLPGLPLSLGQSLDYSRFHPPSPPPGELNTYSVPDSGGTARDAEGWTHTAGTSTALHSATPSASASVGGCGGGGRALDVGGRGWGATSKQWASLEGFPHGGRVPTGPGRPKGGRGKWRMNPRFVVCKGVR